MDFPHSSNQFYLVLSFLGLSRSQHNLLFVLSSRTRIEGRRWKRGFMGPISDAKQFSRKAGSSL